MTQHSPAYSFAPTTPYASLPRDMQTLIAQFSDGGAIPEQLPIVSLELAALPRIPLDHFDRGSWHARYIRPEEAPPFLIADGYFLDGKHRRFAFEERGVDTVYAVDLSGIASAILVECNHMGRLGEPGPGYGTERSTSDHKCLAVWNYATQRFEKESGNPTLNILDADLLSTQEIAERFASHHDFECFSEECIESYRLELKIEYEGDGRWHGRFTGYQDTALGAFSSYQECLDAAGRFAQASLLGRKDIDPFPLAAYEQALRLSADATPRRKSTFGLG